MVNEQKYPIVQVNKEEAIDKGDMLIGDFRTP